MPEGQAPTAPETSAPSSAPEAGSAPNPPPGQPQGVRTLPPDAGALRVGREHDRTQGALEALRAKRDAAQGKTAEQPDAPAPEQQREPAAKPTPEPPKAADKAPEPPKQAEPKPEADYQAKVDKLTRSALENERKFREAEQQLKELRDKAERFEKLKSNPLDLLKDAGHSFEDLVRKAAKGELRATTDHDLAIEKQGGEVAALREQIDALTAKLEGRETEERTTRERQAASQRIREREEALPVSSALDWASDWAHQQWSSRRQQGQDVSFDQVADELEQHVMGDFRALMLNERALKSLLADSEVKASVQRALGARASAQSKQPTPASSERGSSASDGPSAIPREVAAEPGTRTTGGIPSAAERVAAARERLRQRRSA